MNTPSKFLSFACGLAVLILAGLGAEADQLPAVSGPNGKISVEGGSFDDDSSGLALGSFTMPLGPSFGLQADGAVGAIDDQALGGGGLHLFTRDPSSYLLGVYGSYHTWDEINIWRAAGEFELYLSRFSFSGLAGYERVGVPTTSNGLLVLTPDDEHFFAQTDLAYYITDDFMISGGYRYLNEASFAGASAEYLFRAHDVPMSLFANGDFGDEDYTRITGGLRIYLSGDPGKSLIDRHRMDDPQSYMPVFPTLKTVSAAAGGSSLPICAVVSGSFKVTSPADGNCICPSGSAFAGQKPSAALGGFFCSA